MRLRGTLDRSLRTSPLRVVQIPAAHKGLEELNHDQKVLSVRVAFLAVNFAASNVMVSWVSPKRGLVRRQVPQLVSGTNNWVDADQLGRAIIFQFFAHAR